MFLAKIGNNPKRQQKHQKKKKKCFPTDTYSCGKILFNYMVMAD